ncbi:MAG: tetratricopeptide repeat protein [Deltaproteobacteria bacterium]|nr:tetratricopeptide repeat protein [Deltaproteobacteria bacterium]
MKKEREMAVKSPIVPLMETFRGRPLLQRGRGKDKFALFFVAFAFFALYSCSAAQKNAEPVLSSADEAAIQAGEAFRRGDFSRAETIFNQALRLYRTMDDRPGELQTLINLGRTHIVLGGFEEAKAVLDGALVLAARLGDAEKTAEVYATLSKAHHLSGSHAEALEYIEKSLSMPGIKDSQKGERLNLKGMSLMGAGKNAEARAAIVEALRLNDSSGAVQEAANSKRALASMNIAEGDPGRAFRLFSEAYEIDKASGDPRKIASDLFGMGNSLLAGKKPDDAVFVLERAYLVSYNAGFLKDSSLILDVLIDALKESGDEARGARYIKLREGINPP